MWKLGWHSLFFGLGVAAPVLGSTPPLEDPTYCGGYTPWVCQAYVEQATLGSPSQSTIDHIKQVSTGYYIDKVKIPVLLSQGQADSLFNIHEAVATYDQLTAQGNEVRMLWQSWGHTAGTPVAGELDTGTLEPGTADLRDTSSPPASPARSTRPAPPRRGRARRSPRPSTSPASPSSPCTSARPRSPRSSQCSRRAS